MKMSLWIFHFLSSYDWFASTHVYLFATRVKKFRKNCSQKILVNVQHSPAICSVHSFKAHFSAIHYLRWCCPHTALYSNSSVSFRVDFNMRNGEQETMRKAIPNCNEAWEQGNEFKVSAFSPFNPWYFIRQIETCNQFLSLFSVIIP